MKRDYKGLTPEQKYDLLTKDFLERDGDTFVRIRTSDRLGWEETLPEDGAYSAVILNPKSERELYLNAVGLARQMIVAMNTPFRVNVRVSPERSCTDGHTVFVATKVFDDPELPLGKKLDTFLGLTVHEGSHLLYTDFKELEKNDNIIVHKLQNIFEDERIERELGEQKPGLANFLKATKYYYFDLYEKRQEEKNVEPNDATRLFNAILSLVRYPAKLDVEDARRFADELLQVRDLLTPYPESTKECIEVAKEVYELLKKFMANPPAPKKEKPQDQGKNRDGSSGRDEDDDKKNRPDNGKENDGRDEDRDQNADGEQESENDPSGEQDADGNPGEGSSGKSESPENDRSQDGDTSGEPDEDGEPDADAGTEEESDDPEEGTDDLPGEEEPDAAPTSGDTSDPSEDEGKEGDGREEEGKGGDEQKIGDDDEPEEEDGEEGDGESETLSPNMAKGNRKQDGGSDTDSDQDAGQEQTRTSACESPCGSSEAADKKETDGDEPGDEVAQEELPPLTDEEINDILSDIIEALDELSGHEEREPGDTVPEDDAAQALQNDSLIAKECDGELEIGHSDNTVVIKERPNRARFEQSLGRVRKYIPAIAAALRSHGTSYSYIVTGTRSGLLDTNKLCEARQGVQNVYMRKGEVKADRLNVALVIDESGSMSGIREQLARDTAVLVNEAVGNLRDISLHVYGYTGDWTNAILIPYREGKTLQDRLVLGSITSRGGTPTAKAMSEALWRIRRGSREKGIMLVISDGMADGGTTEVRNATDSLQKQGFEVIGISISSSLTKECLAQMYDHYVVMDRLDNLASELGKTVKAAILRLSKRTIS